MIQITPHMRILLAVEPVDFRKGIDGLAGVCKNILDEDPFAGYLFIFANKKRTSLKRTYRNLLLDHHSINS